MNLQCYHRFNRIRSNSNRCFRFYLTCKTSRSRLCNRCAWPPLVWCSTEPTSKWRSSESAWKVSLVHVRYRKCQNSSQMTKMNNWKGKLQEWCQRMMCERERMKEEWQTNEPDWNMIMTFACSAFQTTQIQCFSRLAFASSFCKFVNLWEGKTWIWKTWH